MSNGVACKSAEGNTYVSTSFKFNNDNLVDDSHIDTIHVSNQIMFF